MTNIEKSVKLMRAAPQNVRFSELSNVCEHYFGPPRNKGTSHHIYKTPWQGDPRVNIQKDKNGKAKAYQVKQVLSAIERLKEQDHD